MSSTKDLRPEQWAKFHTADPADPFHYTNQDEAETINGFVKKAELDISGGTIAGGRSIIKAILGKASLGEAVDPLLLDSKTIGTLVVAKSIPVNIGMALELYNLDDEQEDDAKELLKAVNSDCPVIELGNSGLQATVEVVREENDFRINVDTGISEIERFRRSPGFIVLPQFPILRASLVE